MSHIMEPLKQHIHGDMCDELNDMSIRIKAHYLIKRTPENQNQIDKVRQNHPEPTWDEILSLIERCHKEMNQCTKLYRTR